MVRSAFSSNSWASCFVLHCPKHRRLCCTDLRFAGLSNFLGKSERVTDALAYTSDKADLTSLDTGVKFCEN